MLDDFRKEANEGSLFEDDDPVEFDELGELDQEYDDFEDETQEPEKAKGPFLGMTAQQRFILSAMLLVLTCTLSFLTLLVTGRIVF